MYLSQIVYITLLDAINNAVDLTSLVSTLNNPISEGEILAWKLLT